MLFRSSVQHGTPNACTQCHIDASRLPDAEQKLLAGKQYLDWLNLAKNNPVIDAELKRLDNWSQENVLKWYGPDRQTPHYGEVFHQVRADGGNTEAYRTLRKLISNRRNQHTLQVVRQTLFDLRLAHAEQTDQLQQRSAECAQLQHEAHGLQTGDGIATLFAPVG